MSQKKLSNGRELGDVTHVNKNHDDGEENTDM